MPISLKDSIRNREFMTRRNAEEYDMPSATEDSSRELVTTRVTDGSRVADRGETLSAEDKALLGSRIPLQAARFVDSDSSYAFAGPVPVSGGSTSSKKKMAGWKVALISVGSVAGAAALGVGGYVGYKYWEERKGQKSRASRGRASLMPRAPASSMQPSS